MIRHTVFSVVSKKPDQNPLTFSRPPVTVLPFKELVSTVLDRIAFLICAALAPENLCASG